MNCLPIIQRELTVASRRRETWALRLFFAGGLGLAYIAALFVDRNSLRTQGPTALLFLAFAGFSLSIGAGPYLTADAISSEKREGTLGLLFLTPLNGLQLVLGKMVTHSLQVILAVLGAIPFLFLPLLLGGVTWGEIVRIVLVLLLTLLLSLALGIFWSTLAEEARTTGMGSIVSMLMLILVPWLGSFVRYLASGGTMSWNVMAAFSPAATLIQAFDSAYRSPGGRIAFGFSGAGMFWMSAALQVLLAVAFIAFAGVRLTRSWRLDHQTIGTPKEPGTGTGTGDSVDKRANSVPLRKRRFSRAQSRLRRQQPLVWLAGRHLDEGRWVWALRWALVLFFGIMLVIAVTTSRWQQGFIAALFATFFLHLISRLQLSWASIRWLQEDRRTGALELLLTTPITESEVVEAHHDSLRRAQRRILYILLGMNVILQVTVVCFWEHLHMDNDAGHMFTIFFVGGALVTLADFVTVRWLGLREGLRQPTPSKAASRVFVSLYAVAWAILVLMVVVISNGMQKDAAMTMFKFWYGICLGIAVVQVAECRRWLGKGLRVRAAE